LKIVCGKCSAEVELPKPGESPEVHCPSCGATFLLPSLADGEELSRPDAFPGYRVVAIVGYGGMGAVYRAVQLSMDREVAIKVLLRKYTHVPRFVARFEREASALAALSHPNIVGVIDRGREGDTYYFVMEYVHGRTLRYLIRTNQVGVERATDIAIQICRALEAAHAAGVIHRDIKPSNILVQEDGAAKVADFGIAHIVEEDEAVERERRSRLGTAKYMAPEQRGTGETVDGRADLYALGVTLHEMLTGDLPSGTPASETNKLAPEELDAIIERATRPNRDERFQSAAEMRAALEAVQAQLKLEETSATAVLPPVAPTTLHCPACGEGVPADQGTCPACGAAVIEPCYRAGCGGMNLVGAERCGVCGSHLRLVEGQRRTELEAALQRAEASLGAGELTEALQALEEIEGDPHRAFDDLRQRAGEGARRIRARRRNAHIRSFALGFAAVLILALAIAIFLFPEAFFGKRQPDGKKPVEPVASVHPGTSARVRPRPRPRPQPRPAPPRDAFNDYLVALTDRGWSKHAPGLRLTAACDAGLCLAGGDDEGQARKRLGRTLAEIGQGQAANVAPDALAAQIASGLDALCRVLFRELRRQPQMDETVKHVHGRHAKAWKSAANTSQKLDLAASTLCELMAIAEARPGTKPDDAERLLLLDVSLTAGVPGAELRRTSHRVATAGKLLVRYVDRDASSPAVPELLHDARGRLRQAELAQDDLARLAFGLEALVEALGARALKDGSL